MQQARLVPGHALCAQALRMARTRVENQPQIRTQHRAQSIHVAGVADARLQHPKIFLPVRGQHGAGHADLVVVVQGVAGRLTAHGQHLRQHFLERSFARRARDAHYPGPGSGTPQRGNAPQGRHRIRHQQHRRAHRRQRPLRQHRACAPLHGRCGKIVAIHAAAGHADKECAGAGLAAVRHCSGQQTVVPAAGQAQMGCYFRVTQAQCSNSRTTSWSL